MTDETVLLYTKGDGGRDVAKKKSWYSECESQLLLVGFPFE